MNFLQNHKNILIFWGRMTGWVTTSCVLPISVFAKKFGLFKIVDVPVTDSLGNIVSASPPTLNGWGIISCLIVGVAAISIMKEVVKAYEGYSLTKQVFTGIIKTIIPLSVFYFILYFLKGAIPQLMFCTLTVGTAQLVSIPLNPLPKWRYEKHGTEDYSSVLSDVVKGLKDKAITSNKKEGV